MLSLIKPDQGRLVGFDQARKYLRGAWITKVAMLLHLLKNFGGFKKIGEGPRPPVPPPPHETALNQISTAMLSSMRPAI